MANYIMFKRGLKLTCISEVSRTTYYRIKNGEWVHFENDCPERTPFIDRLSDSKTEEHRLYHFSSNNPNSYWWYPMSSEITFLQFNDGTTFWIKPETYDYDMIKVLHFIKGDETESEPEPEDIMELIF